MGHHIQGWDLERVGCMQEGLGVLRMKEMGLGLEGCKKEGFVEVEPEEPHMMKMSLGLEGCKQVELVVEGVLHMKEMGLVVKDYKQVGIEVDSEALHMIKMGWMV